LHELSSESIVQQAEELLRFSIEFMTAAAQPTPVRTLKASVGQFCAQAPHSIQASRSMISTLPFVKLKTAWGQTSKHVPQPMHFSASSLKVTTSLR
jgi:hypothetical protein